MIPKLLLHSGANSVRLVQDVLFIFSASSRNSTHTHTYTLSGVMANQKAHDEFKRFNWPHLRVRLQYYPWFGYCLGLNSKSMVATAILMHANVWDYHLLIIQVNDCIPPSFDSTRPAFCSTRTSVVDCCSVSLRALHCDCVYRKRCAYPNRGSLSVHFSLKCWILFWKF